MCVCKKLVFPLLFMCWCWYHPHFTQNCRKTQNVSANRNFPEKIYEESRHKSFLKFKHHSLVLHLCRVTRCEASPKNFQAFVFACLFRAENVASSHILHFHPTFECFHSAIQRRCNFSLKPRWVLHRRASRKCLPSMRRRKPRRNPGLPL